MPLALNVVTKDWFARIVAWNQERGLIARGFNYQTETSFIIEELLESTGNFTSESGRKFAKILATKLENRGTAKPEQLADAFADIIVFATGAITKLGYDPTRVMEEVYLEINSRRGSIIDGKFVKDESAIPYIAQLSSCKL